MNTIEFIVAELMKIKISGNDKRYSCSYYPVSSEYAALARKKFNIDVSETILYVLTYNSSNNIGTLESFLPLWPLTAGKSIFVITDVAIRKAGDGVNFTFPWSEIKRVKYKYFKIFNTMTSNIPYVPKNVLPEGVLRIYYNTESEQVYSDITYVSKNVLFEGVPIRDVAQFIKNVSKYVQSIKSPEETLVELFDTGKIDQFMVESENFISQNNNLALSTIRSRRVIHLTDHCRQQAYNEARLMFLNFHNVMLTEDKDSEVQYKLVEMYEDLCGEFSKDGKAEVLPYWTKCRDIAHDEVSRLDFQQRIDLLYKQSINKFLDIPYHRRVFLAIDSKLSMFPETIKVLKRDILPEGIVFTNGHPKETVLYICHPYNNNLYIPYETCEFELFKDKVSEYCEVLQCLGAKEVYIEDVINDESTTNTSKNLDINAEVGMKINSLKVDTKNTKNSKQYESFKRKLGRHQVYDPVCKPHIPDGLVWYPHETDWQRLFTQRQQGSVIKHNELLSISTELQTSRNELTSVKAEFKALILKIKGGVESEVDSMFENNTSSEWKVSVEFFPLSELPSATPIIETQNTPIPIENKRSDAEKKYLDEVMFYLENDGVINEKERRLLKRAQARLGISEECAKAIEDAVVSGGDISAKEKEYLELYQEFMEDDGVIDEKERRILQREQTRLGISKERISELESQ